MDTQEMSHTMACTVVIVKTMCPQVLSCENIQLRACCPFRETRASKSDVSFEYQSKLLLHLIAHFTNRNSTSDIGSAICVLAT